MADFNLTVTVPDNKVNDLKEMIDERMNSEFGYSRKTTDEEGNEVVNYNYLQWIELLIKEKLRANYKGWIKSKSEKDNEAAIEAEAAEIITN